MSDRHFVGQCVLIQLDGTLESEKPYNTIMFWNDSDHRACQCDLRRAIGNISGLMCPLPLLGACFRSRIRTYLLVYCVLEVVNPV